MEVKILNKEEIKKKIILNGIKSLEGMSIGIDFFQEIVKELGFENGPYGNNECWYQTIIQSDSGYIAQMAIIAPNKTLFKLIFDSMMGPPTITVIEEVDAGFYLELKISYNDIKKELKKQGYRISKKNIEKAIQQITNENILEVLVDNHIKSTIEGYIDFEK